MISIKELRTTAEIAIKFDTGDSKTWAFIAACDPATVLTLLDALEKAEEALNFYARKTTYLTNYDESDAVEYKDIESDQGSEANKALQELREVIGE